MSGVDVTDLITRIREQPREVLDTIAKSMNVRASEPAMQAICARYMARIVLPHGARVLEVGCGNGAATKLAVRRRCGTATQFEIRVAVRFCAVRRIQLLRCLAAASFGSRAVWQLRRLGVCAVGLAPLEPIGLNPKPNRSRHPLRDHERARRRARA